MFGMIKWLVVILVVLGGGWFLYTSGILTKFAPAPALAPQAVENTTTPPPSPPENTNGMSAATDASDAAIDQDTGAVDAQLALLATDTTNVDTSVNDKPLTQLY